MEPVPGGETPERPAYAPAAYATPEAEREPPCTSGRTLPSPSPREAAAPVAVPVARGGDADVSEVESQIAELVARCGAAPVGRETLLGSAPRGLQEVEFGPARVPLPHPPYGRTREVAPHGVTCMSLTPPSPRRTRRRDAMRRAATSPGAPLAAPALAAPLSPAPAPKAATKAKASPAAPRVQVLQVQNFDFSGVGAEQAKEEPAHKAPSKPKGAAVKRALDLAAAAQRENRPPRARPQSARPSASSAQKAASRPLSARAAAGRAQLGAALADEIEQGADSPTTSGSLADHVAAAQRRAAEATAAALRAAEEAERETGGVYAEAPAEASDNARQGAEEEDTDDAYAKRYPLMAAILEKRKRSKATRSAKAAMREQKQRESHGSGDGMGVDGLTDAERSLAYSDTMAAFEALEASLLAASDTLRDDAEGDLAEGEAPAAATAVATDIAAMTPDEIVEMTRRYYDPAREGLAFSGAGDEGASFDTDHYGEEPEAFETDAIPAEERPPPPPVGERERLPEDGGDEGTAWSEAFDFRDAELIERQRASAARQNRRPQTAPSGGGRVRYLGPPPPGTTKVKPFSFDTRDSAPRKSISQMRLEQDLAAAKAREERELKVRFKAQPVPASTLLPLYAQLVEAGDKRRSEVRRMCKEWLKSIEAPFSFQNRQTKSSAAAQGFADALGVSDAAAAFKANPVPVHVKELRYMEMVADDHKRKFVNKALADAKYREAKLPPRMEAHAKRLAEDQANEVEVLDPECTFKPHIKHSIPDYAAQQRRFEEALAARRQELPTTTVEPFTLASKERQTQERIKRESMLAKARKQADHDEAEAIEHRWPYYSKRGEVPKKIMPDFHKQQRSFGEKLASSRAEFEPTVPRPFELGRDQTEKAMRKVAEAAAKVSAPTFAHQRPTRSEELRLQATRQAAREGRYDNAEEKEAKKVAELKLSAQRRQQTWERHQAKKAKEEESLGLGPDPVEAALKSAAKVKAPAPAEAPAVAAVTTAKGKGKEKPADEGDVVAHDGEALHRQARHRQQAERAATMVEQTLLEHGVYDYVEGTGVPSPGPTPR